MTRQRVPRGVLWISDGRGDVERLVAIAEAALAGGVCGVQLREPGLDARALGAAAARIRPHCDAAGALLWINDRADVAAATAHGVHLGHRSLSAAAVRRWAPADLLLSVAVHDAEAAAGAGADRADCATLAPVFDTTCKPGARPLGVAAAAAIAADVALPIYWLGGIDAARAAQLRAVQPFGLAVRSAIAAAADPRAAARALVAGFRGEEAAR